MLDPTQTAAPAPPLDPSAAAPMPGAGQTPLGQSAVASGTAPAPPKPDMSNRFVQRAVLYNEQTQAQAQRLAAATTQPPANTTNLAANSDLLSKAWNFSPNPDPASAIWALYDQTLQKNLAQVPPNAPPEVIQGAHNDAESQALNTIFPYRGELMGVGTKQLDDQVQQAERIKRLVGGEAATPADTDGSPQAAGPAPAMPTPMPSSPAAPPVMAPPSTPSGPPLLSPQGGPV